MTEFDPRSGSSQRPNGRERDRGASIGLLAAAALLVVALAIGLFLWGTAQRQIASDKTTAPSLTTGSATSKPNTTGVTPPASR